MKTTQPTKITRFPGIVAFARHAGVTRIHAYRVLRGERKSPRLTKLWREFQQQRKAS